MYNSSVRGVNPTLEFDNNGEQVFHPNQNTANKNKQTEIDHTTRISGYVHWRFISYLGG